MEMTGKWFDTFVFIVLENTGWSQVQNCAFVDWFRKNGTIFENWHGVTHPSGPNYRAMLSGQTWSSNEYDRVNRDNVSKHVDYVVYSYKGDPELRHDPFLDLNPPNVSHHRSLELWNGKNKPITYLGMSDDNNAHSGPLDVADKNTMEAINIFKNTELPRTLFMVTFDEAFGAEYAVNRVFTGFAGDNVTVGKEISVPLSHYNLARFLADNWNID
jgi:hypothetical protein